MDAKFGLPAVNFFLADVGGGLGSFLPIWLAQAAGWDERQVGWVLAIGSLSGALLGPLAGSTVDRLGKPRVMLAIATCGIIVGTLVMLPFHSFWIVLAAQIVVAGGGALGGPSISGLTLSIVGKKGYPKQQGLNEASHDAGNVTAAALIAGLALLVGPIAAVVVLMLMAASTLVVLFLMKGDQISFDRMRGRGRREKGAKRGATRALAKDRRLWTLLSVVLLFQIANAVMLPLLGERMVHQGDIHATSWMSACVIVASLTMIPVALLVGHKNEGFGRRYMLIVACGVVIGRCLLATFAKSHLWLIPIEILDGMCAATFSVTVPLAIADLTYGGGRTQTAMGTMAMMQAGGAALANVGWGYAVTIIGYPATFGAMALFAGAAILLLFTFELNDERSQSAADAFESGKAAAISAAA